MSKMDIQKGKKTVISWIKGDTFKALARRKHTKEIIRFGTGIRKNAIYIKIMEKYKLIANGVPNVTATTSDSDAETSEEDTKCENDDNKVTTAELNQFIGYVQGIFDKYLIFLSEEVQELYIKAIMDAAEIPKSICEECYL